MSPSTSKIPESLQKVLQAGNVIPFVGAGISRSIYELNKNTSIYSPHLFPGWEEFLLSSAKKLRGEGKDSFAKDVEILLQLSSPDFLKSAQIAHDSLGGHLWNKLLTDNFANKEALANPTTLELPKLMWKLGSNLVITTNVDDVLEWNKVNAERIQTLNTQTQEFAEIIRNELSSPTLIYLHGSIKDKVNIVFTQKQYTEFYDNGSNKAKLETLRSLLTSKTFLFLGFSLDDPYFVRQLQYIHDIYQGAASSFYVLLRETERGKANIPSFVTPIHFEDFGEPLRLMIAEMSEIANAKESAIIVEDEKPLFAETKNTAFFNVEYYSKGDSFVGRKGKQEAIFDALQKEGRAVIGQVSVEGFGGLGKTQLAVEFAHKYRDCYLNGVYWLIADANIDNQLLKIATDNRWIFVQDKEINQLDEAKRRFKKLKECLIIFDNVEALETIKDYFPRTDSKTHILLTSRESMQGVHSIDLETLSPEESRELLLKTAEREAESVEDNEYLEKILKELDGLPLAIELVGGYLCEHQNISFKEYNEFLNEYPLSELEQEFPQGSFTDHDRSIVRTLRISEKLFTDKPLLVECLNILAWSGSSSMGISLLEALAATENTFKLKTQLGDGHKLKLLKYDKDKDRYEIHRLLGKVIKHDFTLETQQEWHKEIVGKLEKWFETRADEYEHLAESEAEIEHLKQWQEQTLKHLSANSVVLTFLQGDIHYRSGSYQKAFNWFNTAYELYEKEKIEDKCLLSDILDAIGSTSFYLGIYLKGLKSLEQALKIRLEMFGETHKYTATSYSNISMNSQALGNNAKAFEYQKKALKIRIDVFGEIHPDVAMSYNNIGGIYKSLRNHKKALESQQNALEIRKNLFGDTHPDTANSYHNLGGCYYDSENYPRALEYQDKGLNIRKQLLGRKHPDTANSYNSVGTTYGRLGNLPKALEYQETALKIRKEIYGDKHPDTANSYNNVGGAFAELGNVEKSIENYQKAVEILQEFLGSQHSRTILSCKNLIIALIEAGKIERARKEAGKIFRFVPQNHPDKNFFEHHGKNYIKLYSKKKRS